jgi:hypothetical protein
LEEGSGSGDVALGEGGFGRFEEVVEERGFSIDLGKRSGIRSVQDLDSEFQGDNSEKRKMSSL